jgi:hypothetical protein
MTTSMTIAMTITVLQLAVASGCLVGLGLALIIWRLVPAQPHLGAAIERLQPDRSHDLDTAPDTPGDLQDRLGLWVQRHAPTSSWAKPPTRELAILGIPVHRYYGERVIFALIGLITPGLFTAVLAIFDISPPIVLPTAAGLVLGAVMSFIPDYNARTNASEARREFTRALGAYIDLVALERAGGSGSTQALESAAEVGDSWVFERIREELARARWAGVAPWDGLTGLSEELRLPELADLADIMRLSGEQGATVYTTLRARSQSLRTASLTDEQAKANVTGEKLTVPVSTLSLIFLALLMAPALIRVVFG